MPSGLEGVPLLGRNLHHGIQDRSQPGRPARGARSPYVTPEAQA
jgi:hypothetical protein